MKKINFSVSDKEYRALADLIDNSIECCRSGCIWDECHEAAMKIKNEDKRYNYCDRCAFTKAVAKLKEKFFGEDENK